MSPDYVLLTWQTVNGQTVCHLYASSEGGGESVPMPLTRDDAQAAGERRQAAAPGLQFVVLRAEVLRAARG